jgi:hypothetical protein
MTVPQPPSAVDSATLPTTLDPSDGYPADAAIDAILHNKDPNGARWLVETFPLLVAELPCGQCSVVDRVDDRGRALKVIRMSTGGWSGQEDLVSAVKRSLIGIMYLWSWRSGGHYEFRVPVSRL